MFVRCLIVHVRNVLLLFDVGLGMSFGFRRVFDIVRRWCSLFVLSCLLVCVSLFVDYCLVVGVKCLLSDFRWIILVDGCGGWLLVGSLLVFVVGCWLFLIGWRCVCQLFVVCVLCVVCCGLLVVWCLIVVICCLCLLFVVWILLLYFCSWFLCAVFGVCCPLCLCLVCLFRSSFFFVRCWLLVVRCSVDRCSLFFFVCWLLVAGCCSFLVACCLPVVARCVLFVFLFYMVVFLLMVGWLFVVRSLLRLVFVCSFGLCSFVDLGLLVDICWLLVVVLLLGDCCVCDVLSLIVLCLRCVFLFVEC